MGYSAQNYEIIHVKPLTWLPVSYFFIGPFTGHLLCSRHYILSTVGLNPHNNSVRQIPYYEYPYYIMMKLLYIICTIYYYI